jgi:alpha-tubulin suppressor-like RCC1 family protein
MPYKISGTVSDDCKILIFDESDWVLEAVEDESAGSYEVTGLTSWRKIVAARTSSGELKGYGYVQPTGYSSEGEYDIRYMWGVGENGNGQLGVGDTTDRSNPVPISPDVSNWSLVEAGEWHTIATQASGTLWAWGENGQGQLGLGNTTDRSSPVQVGSDTWIDISASNGYYYAGQHSAGVKSDGTLWVWGNNDSGQLGQGDTTTRSEPIQVGSDTDWIKVSCGDQYTIALKSNGRLYAFGNNYNGRLGIGNTTNQSSPVMIGSLTSVVDVDCGAYHSLAMTSNGYAYGWGEGTLGELGNNDSGGENVHSNPVQVQGVTNWSKVSAGLWSSAGLTDDGKLYTWGYNSDGQLGLGDRTSRSIPVQVGTDTTWVDISSGNEHKAGVKNDGTLWSWGTGQRGVLGQGNTTAYSSPVQVGSKNTWKSVSCGYYYAIALEE